jgi:gamma-glutamylcyclotransferase (GGCT)/AIG2-like uncharacterized protein YtfP
MVVKSSSQRLAVYGTLRRGEANHHLIADLGEPKIGAVRGRLRSVDGFPVLTLADDGDEVTVEVYESPALTGERWAKLDEFEGPAYRRTELDVLLRDGSHVAAMCYCDAVKFGR